MSDQFDTWKALLDIAKTHATIKSRRDAMMAAGITCIPDEPHSGYYRAAIEKGAVPLPVGIWRDGDDIIVEIGGSEGRLERVWPYCAWHPVPYEWYEAKIAGIEWPDLHAAAVDAAESTVDAAALGWPGGTAPPSESPEQPKEQTEEERAKAAIDAKLIAARDYATIDSDEMRDRAQALRSDLNSLSGKAKKRREALAFPFKEKIDKIEGVWKPLERSAKDGADKLRGSLDTWATVKVQRQRAEQSRLAEEARQREAEQVKEPEPGPDWRSADAAPPPGDNAQLDLVSDSPPPPPTASPPPAPITTSFRGGTGRAAREKTYEAVTGFSDQDATYQHFRECADVKALLLKLAQQIVDDTGVIVPGVTTEPRAKVR